MKKKAPPAAVEFAPVTRQIVARIKESQMQRLRAYSEWRWAAEDIDALQEMVKKLRRQLRKKTQELKSANETLEIYRQ